MFIFSYVFDFPFKSKNEQPFYYGCSHLFCIYTTWWAGMDSNHRTQMRTDLQSAAFSHSATYPYIKKNWCSLKDSNLGPTGYEPVALTNWAKGASLKRKTYYKIFCTTCQYFFQINTKFLVVARSGIEPLTRGFSVPCSTNWATKKKKKNI